MIFCLWLIIQHNPMFISNLNVQLVLLLLTYTTNILYILKMYPLVIRTYYNNINFVIYFLGIG